jgi:LPXTG-motif cell wall-anchored protein
VTLTAKAKDGYRLKAFVVNGKEIAGNTFTMSNGNVIVTAEFEKIGGSSSVTTSGFGQSPKTGDSSLPSLWLALLCGSLAGLSWLIARRKMRSSQN